MLTVHFSDIAHLQKASVTTCSENVPDSHSSVNRRNITFQVLIFEKIHVTETYLIIFLVYIWNHGVEFIYKILGIVLHLAIRQYFRGLKLSFFFILKIIIKK